MVSLDFDRPSSLTSQQTSAPGQSGFPEKYGHGRPGGTPSGFSFFQALKLAMHAVPAWRYRHEELAHG
jgi:hypothetical protein